MSTINTPEKTNIETFKIRENKTVMPWYIKLFSGLFAWLSGCFFLSFLVVADLVPAPGLIALVLGIAVLYYATKLSQSEPGPFLSQVSLALSVTGHILIIASVIELLGGKTGIILPITCSVLWTVLYLPAKSGVHRFFSTILLWSSVTIYIFSYLESNAFIILVPLQTLAALFLAITSRTIRGFEISKIGKPAVIASAGTALLALKINSNNVIGSYFKPLISPLPLSIFFGVVSIVLIGYFADSYSNLKKTPHIFGVITIIAMSFFAPPGLMAAIAFGIMGFGTSNTLLLGTATLFLPLFLFVFYYDLKVSLAWKSWVLAGSGALILLVRKIAMADPKAEEAKTANILTEDESSDESGQKDGKVAPFRYHRHIFYGTCIFIIFAINGMIVQKELILKNGESLLLRLVPVDPRSLMQGDYMILRYKMVDKLRRSAPDIQDDGAIIVEVNNNLACTFKELDNGRKLASNERRIAFKYRSNKIKLGAESFFFQEGHGKIYEDAKYGELKVKKSGGTVLVGLRDGNFKVLAPPGLDGEKPGWLTN